MYEIIPEAHFSFSFFTQIDNLEQRDINQVILVLRKARLHISWLKPVLSLLSPLVSEYHYATQLAMIYIHISYLLRSLVLQTCFENK